MNQEVMMDDPKGDAKDDREKYLKIIKSSASPYNFSSEVNERLWDIISKGLHKSKTVDKNNSRTLEIEENCILLGNQIRELAFENGHSKSTLIPMDILENVLSLLCPGLWPFC